MTALGRYYVMRDQALEAGDEAGVLAADLGLEMVHRPPEEWELERVTLYFSVSWLEPGGLGLLPQTKLRIPDLTWPEDILKWGALLR